MNGVNADGPTSPEVDAKASGPQSRDIEMDVIEAGPRRPPLAWWRGRGIATLTAVALVVGAVIGYLVGIQRGASQPRTVGPGPHVSTPGSMVTAAAQPVIETGNQCSVQLGDRLQLGVEIVNRSATTATLRRVEALLPLPGLRVTAGTWGSCGQLSAVDTGALHQLPPDATTWLTITFDVLIPCPRPIPVLFTLTYTEAGHTAISGQLGRL